ncbi:MAG: AI-2E family transporter [Bacteroidia bacterium]|nr:AI-2E family transporter [Bacteroidia bacterium]
MNETENNRISGLYRLAAFTIGAAGIVLFLIYARSLLMPIVVSAYLAMLLFPLVSFLEKKKVPRIIAIILAILLSVAVIGGVGWFFTEQIRGFANDLSDIQARFEQLSDELTVWISENLGVKDALEFNDLDKKVFEYLQRNASTISGMAFNTLGSLSLLVLIPVYLFMFLLYRDHFTQFCIRLFRNQTSTRVVEVVSDLRRVIQQYISGVLKVMVILAIMNAIAFYALGIKHALFFAVFAAILNIVPYVGPLVGSIIPIAYALLTKDSLWYPVGVFIAMNVIQTIEGNFLTPKIVGSNVSLNPIASLLALLIGGFMWGVVGMILFIPAAAILKKLLELSPATEVYGFLLGEEDHDFRRKHSILLRWMRRSKQREAEEEENEKE